MFKKKKTIPIHITKQEAMVKDFFDMISPSTIRFEADHLICGDSYRSVWAIREYPPQTTDQALLARFGDKENVTLHIYSRMVDAAEQRKILQNATRKNRMMSASEDVQESVNAEGNMEDVVALLSEMRKNKEPLLHCAVFIELSAYSYDKLKELQTEVSMELTREKITIDRLTVRQKEGFLAVLPCGYNSFGMQFERVLLASSVANLYPFSYSGKTDPNGFYIGRDKYGSNIIVDFDRRSDDKTNANVLILGNSGQGKSYLMKLLLTNLREAGKSIISLDAEQEYEELAENLGGCYIDLMSGKYIINPLEPKAWSENADDEADAPEAFRKSTRLSQHISYLKAFFRSYKDFTDAHIDAIEILVSKLYSNFGITDKTDYSKLSLTDYPIMSDLYELAESEYLKYEQGSKSLFTEELLREICLGINSMCKGAESKFFNGHTRHIVSVFKIIQDLLAPSGLKGKTQFQILVSKLPEEHKARWFAGAALNTSEQAMSSVMSTALSRLNAFLDSELEQILCFDTAIDAEQFCKSKSAIFIVLPEEDTSKHFMVSLIVQQMYREILAVADEYGGKLPNRVMMYLDEFGTIPKIEGAEMMFSASRSRRVSIVAIIQSFAQLQKNYGKEGCEIIIDNTQLTIFGGFAPNSESAQVLSKALGTKTVQSGSVSRSKNDPSQSLQMIERPLLTPDELKSLSKGTFCVMKTGFYPMRVKLKLFFKWGIVFSNDPYIVPDKGNRKVSYANKSNLEDNIIMLYAVSSVGDKLGDEELAKKANHRAGLVRSARGKKVALPKDDDNDGEGDSMPMTERNFPKDSNAEIIFDEKGVILDERLRDDLS